jgi:hypothetical protein
VRCHDDELLGNLRQLYANFLVDRPADINIELNVVDRLKFNKIDSAMRKARIVIRGKRFKAKGLTLEGEFYDSKHTLSITAEKHLFDPGLEFNMMNRLLPTMYYTACKSKYNGTPPALLVHSCGILRRGHVILFTGPSEVGKTTIARLCDEENGQVLNDEMVLIHRAKSSNNSLEVQGVPIIGGFPQRLNAVAPLSCILLLKQSKRTAVRRLDRTEAYLGFMRQVISPADLGQTDSRALFSLIAEFSDEVTGKIPFYELEFTLDPEMLWQAVNKVEKTPV